MKNNNISLKADLEAHNQQLNQNFEDGADISTLLKQRSQKIDSVLQQLWKETGLEASTEASLIAVGGYGREEMHPASDIDLLILLAKEPDTQEEEYLSNFVALLWDLGIEIGQSVRTLDECVTEANNDLTIITNLIESRFISGNNALFNSLQQQLSTEKVWDSKAFFKAKINEQEQRYKRFGDSAYRVEPNLKEGPGGLRDLQTVGWIFLREYGVKSLKTLSNNKAVHLLTPEEYQDIIKARNFLWRVRFILHQLTGKKSDRLLFDFQRPLAHAFGYTNDEHNESIEMFMQRYYRNITSLERLNEILLGLLREHIFRDKQIAPKPINRIYNNHNGYLGLIQPDTFSSHPHTLLEVFHIMQTHPEIKGLTPDTLRALRNNLHLINHEFRSNEHNKQVFINILSEPLGITFVLRRMNRYDLLSAYIPAFSHIVGRMQYDLFHAYTVDDHTLNVIRNIRRLNSDNGTKELPLCSKVFKQLENPTLLYLAGLFHDIAKGRGGSHSELGAVDALEFCQFHGLSDEDAETVSWLVKQHLLLSTTAQRKDISDPLVIKEFAKSIKNQTHLEMLYLLTICDIKGTNPTLLNNWKHSLLKKLFSDTRAYLQNKTKALESTHSLIQQNKETVLDRLTKQGASKEACESFWSLFSDSYFLQHSIEDIIWHFMQIQSKALDSTVSAIRESEKMASSVLLIYTQNESDIFVKIMSAIEQQRLNVVAARISSANNGYLLNTFFLLNAEGQPLTNTHDKKRLLTLVEKNLQQDGLSYSFAHHRMPRQLKHFNAPTEVKFLQDKIKSRTVITIKTVDTAGLLTQISEVFSEQGVNIHDAKISTLGEMAEDIFHVTTRSGRALLNKEKLKAIRLALIEKLDR